MLSTTEFLERNTEAGGTVLRSNENGNCVFLGEHGCTVHPDRPLACRIYPLARWALADGEESFGHLSPHPQTSESAESLAQCKTISTSRMLSRFSK
jgi:Fe-S-cluster containining protein